MSKAARQNPKLKVFEKLIGEWETTGHHPLLPGASLKGVTKFEWIENGAFLMMHSTISHKDIPDGIAIIGTDDGEKEGTMIYFDERGVSRKYSCAMENTIFRWWRNDNEFSQRFAARVSDDGKTMEATGEMRRAGNDWEEDLSMTYTKMEKQ